MEDQSVRHTPSTTLLPLLLYRVGDSFCEDPILAPDLGLQMRQCQSITRREAQTKMRPLGFCLWVRDLREETSSAESPPSVLKLSYIPPALETASNTAWTNHNVDFNPKLIPLLDRPSFTAPPDRLYHPTDFAIPLVPTPIIKDVTPVTQTKDLKSVSPVLAVCMLWILPMDRF